MSLLTPEPGLLFWMLLSFGIVVILLAKYGFPTILKAVNTRQEYIDNSLLAAKKATEELAKVKENSQALLDDAFRKQAEILDQANKTGKQIIEKAKEEAKEEANKMLTNAQSQIQTEKDNALRAIRGEVASLSVDIAEKILREKLNSQEKQTNMIDRLIDGINISKS